MEEVQGRVTVAPPVLTTIVRQTTLEAARREPPGGAAGKDARPRGPARRWKRASS